MDIQSMPLTFWVFFTEIKSGVLSFPFTHFLHLDWASLQVWFLNNGQIETVQWFYSILYFLQIMVFMSSRKTLYQFQMRIPTTWKRAEIITMPTPRSRNPQNQLTASFWVQSNSTQNVLAETSLDSQKEERYSKISIVVCYASHV